MAFQKQNTIRMLDAQYWVCMSVDGLIGILIVFALPFIFCLGLAILIGDGFGQSLITKRKKFLIKVIVYAVSLPVVVPSIYGYGSEMHTFASYWIWFYSTPHMIGILSLGWLIGVVFMLLLQYGTELFGSIDRR